ncbi:MAG: WG repeat-containing protein [Methylovulum sp.]|nr:WG repeat-containing protein [Methylovulum sp.]
MIKLLFIALLMTTSVSFANDAAECWYYSKAKNTEVHALHCVNFYPKKTPPDFVDDALISKKVVIDLDYDADGLAYLRTKDGFLYVNRHGNARPVISYDNGPDYFAEGLARTRQNGKIGYFDKSLKMVIAPAYDFGFPFSAGRAIVCNGCVEQSDGEHKIRVGGLWGAIDSQGGIVQAIGYSSEQIRGLVK